VVTGAGHVVVV
jgi:hypothetical protein